VACGGVARSARRAVIEAREQGIKAGLLKLKTIWPFADKEIEKAGENARRVIVPEMNLGQLAHEVEWVLGRKRNIVKVNKINGEAITPREILDAIVK